MSRNDTPQGRPKPPGLGTRVRERRLELGMSQSELAAAVGANSGDISKLETGKVKLPHRPRLELIARALQLPLGELLARSGWTNVEDYLVDTDPRDIDTLALIGPKADLAELIPRLSMSDAEALLSHAQYLLSIKGGNRARSPDGKREPA